MAEAAKIKGVYEREPGSNVWWIRYADATGKERREKIGRRKTAVTMYQSRKLGVLEGKKLPENMRNRGTTLAQLVDDALAWSKTHKKAHRDDSSRLKRVVATFGHRVAQDITPLEIDAWLSANTRTPATANRYKSTISLVYRQGVRNGRVKVNPARSVAIRAEDNGRVRWLRPDEEKRIRKAMEKDFPHYVPAFDFALNTGLRSGEQFSLKWQDVDLERRTIAVRRTKNGSDRHLPLNEEAYAALLQQKEWSLGSEHVFENRHGRGAMCKSHPWFGPILEAAEVNDFRWHDLRHTFCSRLTMAGVGLKTIQNLAGHKTLAMTARYSHLAQDVEQDALRRLSDFQRTGTKTAPAGKAARSTTNRITRKAA